MGALFVPYHASIFRTLPNLKDSRGAFLERSGEDAVKKLLELTEKHDLTSQYGIGLLHRHFDIGSDKILVEVNGTTTAWKTNNDDWKGEFHIERYGGVIVPHSWMIDPNGHLMP